MNQVFVYYFGTLKMGVRSKGIHILILFTALLLGGAYLAAAFSLRQPMVVALDVGISGLRIGLLFFALMLVQETIAKDFENKTIIFALSYPRKRSHYLTGRLLGVLTLLVIGIAIFTIGLALMASVADWGYADSSRPVLGWKYLLVIFGVFLELTAVTVFSVLLNLFSRTPFLPAILAFAFDIVARGIGSSLSLLKDSGISSIEMQQKLVPVFEKILYFLPDLNGLDYRHYVLYDESVQLSEVFLSSGQVFVWMIIIYFLSILVLDKKDFV